MILICTHLVNTEYIWCYLSHFGEQKDLNNAEQFA